MPLPSLPNLGIANKWFQWASHLSNYLAKWFSPPIERAIVCSCLILPSRWWRSHGTWQVLFATPIHFSSNTNFPLGSACWSLLTLPSSPSSNLFPWKLLQVLWRTYSNTNMICMSKVGLYPVHFTNIDTLRNKIKWGLYNLNELCSNLFSKLHWSICTVNWRCPHSTLKWYPARAHPLPPELFSQSTLPKGAFRKLPGNVLHEWSLLGVSVFWVCAPP